MSQDWMLEEELARARLAASSLARVGAFLAPYKREVAAALAMEVLWCLSHLAGPLLVQRGIDRYLGRADLGALAGLAALYALNTLGRAWLVGLELKLLTGSGQRVVGDIRRAVFDHVQGLCMGFFDRTQQGRVIARVDRDVDALERSLVWGPVTVLSATLVLAFALAAMAHYDARLALVVFACVPTLVLSSEVFRRAGIAAYRRTRADMSRVTAHYAESINGMRVIQASGREAESVAAGRGLIQAVRTSALNAVGVWSAYLPVVNLHYGLSGAAVLFWGGRLVLSGELSVGALVAFLMLLEHVFQPIEELGDLYNELLSAQAAAERVFQVLDTEPTVRERAGARDVAALGGRVEFDGVRLRYAAGAPWALDGVSFAVEPGQTVALVGHTGAGKSTVVSLLCRFYDVTEGAVRLDGVDVRELTLATLRRNIGVIPQDGFLFSGSVFENLRFGRPEASDAELTDAARALGAHELLSALPQGYATEVGERGSRLSHGQRQAVCYVRALLAEPRILILDEATSSLDSASERTLQGALRRLSAGRTTFVVAHRLSTIRTADRILVFSGGKVVEEGAHAALLERGGAYARLHADAFSTPAGWLEA
ncbi:ABC transporter ATP-binding protein [bacterium]|nr:MAG: ABC transporter ATP-binding protein [bacterium]